MARRNQGKIELVGQVEHIAASRNQAGKAGDPGRRRKGEGRTAHGWVGKGSETQCS